MEGICHTRTREASNMMETNQLAIRKWLFSRATLLIQCSRSHLCTTLFFSPWWCRGLDQDSKSLKKHQKTIKNQTRYCTQGAAFGLQFQTGWILLRGGRPRPMRDSQAKSERVEFGFESIPTHAKEHRFLPRISQYFHCLQIYSLYIWGSVKIPCPSCQKVRGIVLGGGLIVVYRVCCLPWHFVWFCAQLPQIQFHSKQCWCWANVGDLLMLLVGIVWKSFWASSGPLHIAMQVGSRVCFWQGAPSFFMPCILLSKIVRFLSTYLPLILMATPMQAY